MNKTVMVALISLFLTCSCFFITQKTYASSLPLDLEWITNDTSPEWSSTVAQKGGDLRLSIPNFPPTLRTVGPGSKNYFRSFLINNQLPLVATHPNNDEIIPILASHWAYDKDGKTVYYKIKQDARWSDGHAVTADDFVFALAFNRSPFINSPWHNNYFKEKIANVIKLDSHTIAIIGSVKKPQKDLHYYYDLRPRAKHFHRLDSRWVNAFNWKIEPNTGPYQILNIRKGKLIAFKRKLNWWAKKDRFLRNRFNIDKISIKVVRDPNIAYKYFERGELDVFNLTNPKLWYEKAKGPMYTKGFIHKLSYYNQVPQSASGLFLNINNNLLQDIGVRKAISHSIDFDTVIKKYLYGEYLRLPSFHSGYGEYSDQTITAPELNIEKAKDYLYRSGWQILDTAGIRMKDQSKLSFTVSYANKIHRSHINLIAKIARKAGIELKPQYTEPMVFHKKILDKRFDIAWLGWSTGKHPEFEQYFHSRHASALQSNNITGLADDRIDDLIKEYQASSSEQESIQLAHALENKIADQALFIPSTYVPFTRAGFWRWLKLPESVATRSSAKIFDPFHPTHGGLFWIDRITKINTLSAKRSGEGFKSSTVIKQATFE